MRTARFENLRIERLYATYAAQAGEIQITVKYYAALKHSGVVSFALVSYTTELSIVQAGEALRGPLHLSPQACLSFLIRTVLLRIRFTDRGPQVERY